MNIKSYVGRILARMDAYINLDNDASPAPQWWSDVSKNIHDDIYGIYQGGEGDPISAVLVGRLGLYIFSKIGSCFSGKDRKLLFRSG